MLQLTQQCYSCTQLIPSSIKGKLCTGFKQHFVWIVSVLVFTWSLLLKYKASSVEFYLTMFLHLLFLVTLLQFGDPQNGARNPTTLNNSSLSLILGDQCVTRDEVRDVIRTEVESIIMRHVAEIQINTAQLFQTYHHGGIANPAPSCRNIPQGSPSGYYWIQTNAIRPTRQYCDMSRTCCNSIGGWMRVANLDMTDPSQQCPSGFRSMSSPRRSCGVLAPGCTSTTFPVHDVEYSRVCGRVIGYQKGSTNAFYKHNIETYTNVHGSTVHIDGYYVDGVSLTHGSSPRKYIWTFAAALDETGQSGLSTCPCTRHDLPDTLLVPPFVGNDYFCETGSRNHFAFDQFYHEDLLWDGQGCGPQSTCCSFNNPPWFCKQLPQPTRDDIELRLCKDENDDNEDIPLEVVELYMSSKQTVLMLYLHITNKIFV